MLRLIIKDFEYKDLGIEYFFEDIEELKKMFFTFVNPIEKNSWLEKYAETCKKPYNKEFVIESYERTFAGFNDSNGYGSCSGTIMNGEYNNSPENFEYTIENIQIIKKYEKPLAWCAGLSFAEVFPQNYKIIEKTYNEWYENINEDCKDSQRVGLVDSEESMKKYETFITCCGSTDEEVIINGVKYMFGCNFGH